MNAPHAADVPPPLLILPLRTCPPHAPAQLMAQALEVRKGDSQAQVGGRISSAVQRWLPLFDQARKAGQEQGQQG